MTVLGFIVVAVLVVIIAYLAVSRSAQGAPRVPDCTMLEAWDYYVEHGPQLSEKDARIIRLTLTKFVPSDIEKLKEDLCKKERESLEADNPLILLRTQIMDMTDFICISNVVEKVTDETLRNELLKSLGYDTLEALSADYVITAFGGGVLRIYAGLHYGDSSNDDWYAFYLKVARLNSDHLIGLFEKGKKGESWRAVMIKPMRQLMKETREKMLAYPPRTPVQELAEEPEPPEPQPLEVLTEEQINQLASVMEERFLRLLNGELYVVKDLPPVNPPGAFQLDAGLLFNFIAERLRNPDDTDKHWRKVIEITCRKYKNDLDSQDLHELLETAQVFREAWIESKDQGPLAQVLAMGAALAFDFKPSEDGQFTSDESNLVAFAGAEMVKDAGQLFDQVNEILAG